MRIRTFVPSLVLCWATLSLPGMVLAGPLPEPFTLGRYIPDDCFLYIHRVHNPDRAFIDEQWARVFAALSGTGVGQDLINLLLDDIPEAERAQFDAQWAGFRDAFERVRWADLIRHEFAVGMRWRGMFPEFILLGRPATATLDDNVTALVALMQGFTAYCDTIRFRQDEIPQGQIWSLSWERGATSLHLIRRGDVLALVLGQDAVADVQALLTRERSEHLVGSPRFRGAIAELPAPTDGLKYFDQQRMLKQLRVIPAMMCPPCEEGAEPGDLQRVGTLFAVLLNQLSIFDFTASVGVTKNGERIESWRYDVSQLAADAPDHPLYKVVAGQRPFDRPYRYIPEEATGFDISSGIDLHALYHAVLDFIKTEFPGGPELLARWQDLQDRTGFHLEEDVFSWYGGETISFALPAAVKTGMAAEDWVVMIRVKDSALAREKVRAGVKGISGLLEEHAGQTLMIMPAPTIKAEGFVVVTHPMIMMFMQPVIGVKDDWLIVGSNASAVNKSLDTAAGRAPAITEQARFRDQGMMDDEPLVAASFDDLSNLGAELGGVCTGMSIAAALIPVKPETRQIKSVLGAVGKLGAAVATIDFLSSKASVTHFDKGRTWRTATVTHYKPAKAKAPVQNSRQTLEP